MRDKVFNKKKFIESVTDHVKSMYRKTLKDASQQELYQAVSETVKDVIMDEWIATQEVMDKKDPKVVYYMSMEFLMGRALGNNLINLSAYKEVAQALREIGVDINAIEDQEPVRLLEMEGLEDLQHVLWIHLLHLDIRHMDAEYVTDMACLNSRSVMASR